MGTSISYLQEGNLIRRVRPHDPGISAREQFFSDPTIQQRLEINASQLTEVVNNANFIQVKNEQGIRVGLKSTYIFITPEHPLYDLAKQALTGEQATQTPPLIPLASKNVVEFADTDPSDLNRRIQELEQELADKRSKIEELQTLIEEWKTAEHDCWQNFSDTSTEPGDGHEILADAIPPVAVAVTHAEIQTHPTSPFTSNNAVGTDPDPIPTTASTKTQTILQLTSAADVQTDPVPDPRINEEDPYTKNIFAEVCQARARIVMLGQQLTIQNVLISELKDELTTYKIAKFKVRTDERLQEENRELHDALRKSHDAKAQLERHNEDLRRLLNELKTTEYHSTILTNHDAELKRFKLRELELKIEYLNRQLQQETAASAQAKQANRHLIKQQILQNQEALAHQKVALEESQEFAQIIQKEKAALTQKHRIEKFILNSDLSLAREILDLYEEETKALHAQLQDLQTTPPTTIPSPPETPSPEPEPSFETPTPVLPLQEVLIERAKSTPSLHRTLARMHWFSLIQNIEQTGNVSHVSLDKSIKNFHPLKEIVGDQIPIETAPRTRPEQGDTKQRVTPLLKQAVEKKHPGTSRWEQFYLIHDNMNGRDIITRLDESRLPPHIQALDDLREFSKPRSTFQARSFQTACKNLLNENVIPLQLKQLTSLKTAPFTATLANNQFIALLQNLASLSNGSAKQELATLLLGNNPGEEVNHALPIIQKIVRFYLLTKEHRTSSNLSEKAYQKMEEIMENIRTLLRPFGDPSKVMVTTPATAAKHAGTTPSTDAHKVVPALPLTDSSVSRQLF